MELMTASLDKLYRKVYATPGRRVPEEVLREIAFAVSAVCLAFSLNEQQTTVVALKPFTTG